MNHLNGEDFTTGESIIVKVFRTPQLWHNLNAAVQTLTALENCTVVNQVLAAWATGRPCAVPANNRSQTPKDF
jgi:hypothetical protein